MDNQPDTLSAIYAEVPGIACKRKCFRSCGPVVQQGVMSYTEVRRLALFPEIPNPGDPLVCTLLDAATLLCRAYQMRPLVCRLWGLVDDPRMTCPHGCEPERILSPEEADELFRRADNLTPGTPPRFRVLPEAHGG